MSAIVGLGTDIVEIVRIGRMIERHGEQFLHRVYTDEEIRYCQRRRECYQHFAGRWAAKEAALKALGTGLAAGIRWRDVEILPDELGRPTLSFHARALERARQLKANAYHVTITHGNGLAMAQVLLEQV